MKHLLFQAILAALAVSAAAGAETSGWRGDGSGLYPDAASPLQWDIDEGKNILWRAEIGKGQSCPVVAAGRIFITAEPDRLVCLDAAGGKVLWTHDNGYNSLPAGTKTPAEKPAASPNCGYATPTPVTDGAQVWASFGTGVVACYDLDGNRKWVRFLDLPLVTQYGRSGSPILAGGKLLVSIGGLAALDPKTGDMLWHAAEAKPTYGTPAAAKIGAADVAITSNGDCVRVSDGKILATKMAACLYTSPVVQDGVAWFAGPPAAAVQLPEKANGSAKPEKLWESDDLEGEFFASPVLHGGTLYCVSNLGVLYALDAKTGKTAWKKELDIATAAGKPGKEAANLYPSIALVGKHLVVSNDAGETLVLVPGAEYKQVAVNYLDKGSGACPVPAGARLYLRGGTRLYCIAEKPPAAK